MKLLNVTNVVTGQEAPASCLFFVIERKAQRAPSIFAGCPCSAKFLTSLPGVGWDDLPAAIA